jgi:hypothetical protein
MLRTGLAAALIALALVPAEAAAQPKSLLVFLPATETKPLPPNPTQPEKDARNALLQARLVLTRLDARPSLSLGLLGATQGRFDQFQALMDMTQGTRVSRATYKPPDPPRLRFEAATDGSASFSGWQAAVQRARGAPADVVPGLLAGAVPGGAGYAGVTGRSQIDAVPAADRSGHVAAISIGPAATIARRAQALLRTHSFVVVDLPTREPGDRALDALLRARAPQEQVIVVESPPERRGPQFLTIGVQDGGQPRGLTSRSTRRDGIVAGIDIAPTVLQHLGAAVPKEVKGEPIRAAGKRDAAGLMALDKRLRVVGGRRMPALQALLFGWVAVLLALGTWKGQPGIRKGVRLGPLALFWVPAVLLATATFNPSRGAELAIIAGGSLALAFLTDRIAPWPRGPLVPAVVGLTAYAIDLAAGSPLIVRSLLGPNPRFGSRYFGLGNELEATLPLLLLIGLAATFPWSRPSRRLAWTFAGAGLALGAIIGSGRLGADVGGVMTVAAGFGVATLVLLPGGASRRAIVAVAAAPVLAVVALAGLDLATGGDSHFTRSVLHAGGAGDLTDVVTRRYTLAYNNVIRGLTPLTIAISLLAVAYAVRNGSDIYRPMRGSDTWRAALLGGLAASVGGMFFNDSGPLLLIFGVFVLLFATLYLRGDPSLAEQPPGPDPPRSDAARSGAAADSPHAAGEQAGQPVLSRPAR